MRVGFWFEVSNRWPSLMYRPRFVNSSSTSIRTNRQMKQRRSGKTDGNKWERVREKMREFLLWYYNAFNKTNTIQALCRQTIVRFEIENAFKSHWVRASGKRSISQRISLFAFSVDKSQTKWLQMDRHKLCNSVHYLQRHNKNKFTIQNKTITTHPLYVFISLSPHFIEIICEKRRNDGWSGKKVNVEHPISIPNNTTGKLKYISQCDTTPCPLARYSNQDKE